MLRIRIILGRYIKTVIADPVMNNADVGGEVGWALRTVRVEEKNGVAYRGKPASSQRPVNNGIMLVGRIHIRDVLGIIHTSHHGLHTYELPFLNQDVPDVPAFADS